MSYKYLWIDGKIVSRARYVLEQKIGRPLTKEEEPHHLDRDKENDSPENLEVMLRYDHKILHLSDGRKFPNNELGRKISSNPNEAWCSGCKQFLLKERFGKNRSHWNGLSKHCSKCRTAIKQCKKLELFLEDIISGKIGNSRSYISSPPSQDY